MLITLQCFFLNFFICIYIFVCLYSRPVLVLSFFFKLSYNFQFKIIGAYISKSFITPTISYELNEPFCFLLFIAYKILKMKTNVIKQT